MQQIKELGTDPKCLFKDYWDAYEALPPWYKSDSSLNFFVDVNGNLCAEHTLHKEEYVWLDGRWCRG
jgi:hypothetical protein